MIVVVKMSKINLST